MTIEQEVNLVGYWNKDLKDPQITFSIPLPGENKQLVVINLRAIAETEDPAIKLKSSIKKLSKELRNLSNIGGRLK